MSKENFGKAPTINVENLPDGSIIYKNKMTGKERYALSVFYILPIILVIMIAMLEFDGDVVSFLPLIIFLIIFDGIMFKYIIAGFKNRSYKITNEHVEFKETSARKTIYQLSEYAGLEYKRNYRRGSGYVGTIYHAVFKNGDTTKKLRLSSIPASTSHFVHELKRRTNKFNYPASDVLQARSFTWSNECSNENKTKSKKLFIMAGILLVILLLGIVTTIVLYEEPFFPYVILGIVTMIISILVAFSGTTKGSFIYPSTMTFESNSLKIDDLYLQASDIKRIYITPVGFKNPDSPSRLYVEIKNGQYKYFTSHDNFDYADFYEYFQSWCVKNNISFIEYIL